MRQLDRQTDAVNGRGETRNEKAALSVREDFIKLTAHRALTGGVSLAFDIGRILKQRQHALFSVLSEGVQIEEMIIRGRGIDFEIARMDNYAERRVNRERNTIHQAVGYADGMNRERPGLEALAGPHLAEVSVLEQSMLVELVLHVSQSELGAPDGHVKFRQNPGQSANVIFVAMGENDAAHPLPILGEIRNVWNNDVHAQQFSFGEHQPCVDHNNIVAPTDGHAVHTELAEAPQRDDLQFSSWH